MATIALVIVFIALGFIVQSILHSPIRQSFDIIAGFFCGFLIGQFSLFLPAFICVGILLRMLISGHIGCSGMTVAFFALGLLVGVF